MEEKSPKSFVEEIIYVKASQDTCVLAKHLQKALTLFVSLPLFSDKYNFSSFHYHFHLFKKIELVQRSLKMLSLSRCITSWQAFSHFRDDVNKAIRVKQSYTCETKLYFVCYYSACVEIKQA